jgi:hypothetical protein
MSLPHPNWRRLVAAARRAPGPDGGDAPHGFATRVVARAFASSAAAPPLLERFALRALGLACLCAVLAVAANYSLVLNHAAEVDRFFTADDPAAILLEFS